MENFRDKQDMTIVKEYISWNDVEEFTSYLANNLDLSKYNGVYGPARGGVTFAAIISNRFDLPYLGAPQVGCLIVDDICDSGNSALCWKNKGYAIATMYYKQGALVTPDLWWKEKTDKWLVFPWEKQD